MKYVSLDAGDVVKMDPVGGFLGSVHVFGEPSIVAINAALAARRPLLIRGEPGTGKSQMARAAAAVLKRAFVSTVVNARTEARDLHWTFDAISRLAKAQVLGALGEADESKVEDELAEKKFLQPGALWWAFDWEGAEGQARDTGIPVPSAPKGWGPDDGVVVLIDEIDKADSSVPNGLLESLGQAQFTYPGGGLVTGKSKLAPLIVITTNEERSLPDAFLRRCLVLQLEWSRERGELIDQLVDRGRAHFPQISEEIQREAAGQLADQRNAVSRRGLCPPGGAEFLDLLRALDDLAKDDAAAQEELIKSLARFAFDKHPKEERGGPDRFRSAGSEPA